ncbi:hypothetical protein SAMN04488057_111116 [Cyclobacterium lianum]|uniref:Uncharacterized protein n=1 Tax=Cyclobacterium lianum TaxID=388280 RepID=A0A1M7PXA5_9BACT|nr:hypothetical protein SAMN04488057_111116 [Cyclobacterium lianum]
MVTKNLTRIGQVFFDFFLRAMSRIRLLNGKSPVSEKENESPSKKSQRV